MVADFSRCGDYCEGLACQYPLLVWALHVSRWVSYHLDLRSLPFITCRKGREVLSYRRAIQIR